MKGLLIKDLKLLKGQKQFFAAVLVMMMIFMWTDSNFSFVITYITIMVSVLTLTTMSYDDFENGLGYLFTLPVSRREYVVEKYLFSVVTILPGMAMVSICSFVTAGIKGIDFSVEECMASVVSGLLVGAVTLSVLIPVQLKFGVEKSRVATMMLFGGGVLVGFLGTKICDAVGIDWMAAIRALSEMKAEVILTGIGVISVAVMLVSYLFSLRVITKREF